MPNGLLENSLLAPHGLCTRRKRVEPIQSWFLFLLRSITTLSLVASTSGSYGADPDTRLWVEAMNGGTGTTKENAVLVNGKPVHVAFDTGTAISFVLFEDCV